jgi:hypothetical protein
MSQRDSTVRHILEYRLKDLELLSLGVDAIEGKKLDRYIKYSSNPFYGFIMDFYSKPPYDVYFQLL